jgi:hypothetical protein
MELLSGHEKIITKSGISLNAGTLNRGFTVPMNISNNIMTIEHQASLGLLYTWLQPQFDKLKSLLKQGHFPHFI